MYIFSYWNNKKTKVINQNVTSSLHTNGEIWKCFPVSQSRASFDFSHLCTTSITKPYASVSCIQCEDELICCPGSNATNHVPFGKMDC